MSFFSWVESYFYQQKPVVVTVSPIITAVPALSLTSVVSVDPSPIVSIVSALPYSERFNSFMPFIYTWECDWPEDKSGQYSNDLDDPGGPTKFGVDLTSAKLTHPTWTVNTIKSLNYDQSIEVYWSDYWQKDKVEQYSYPLGEVFFNANQNGGHPDQWIVQCKGSASAFVKLQEQYYYDLCDYWAKEGKTNPRKYLPGWLNRTADLRKYLKLST